MKVIFLYHHGGHFPYKLSKFSYEGHFLLGHFPFRSFSWSSNQTLLCLRTCCHHSTGGPFFNQRGTKTVHIFFKSYTHAWHKKLLGTYSSEWMQQSVWVIKKLLSGASFPYSCLGKTNKSITSSYKSVPSSVKLSMMHHYQHVDTGWEDHLKQFVPKSTTMSQRFSLTKGKNDWAKILADL